jgi:DNA-binding beta-propeller fold protein YncE
MGKRTPPRVGRAASCSGPALLILLGTAMSCAPPPVQEGRLYVTSGFTDEVLQLDPASGRIVARVSLDRRPHDVDEPHGIAIAPDGRHWYATVAHGEPSLWKFELPENRLVGRLGLAMAGAARIGITPDSRRAFIPDYFRGGPGRDSDITVVTLETLTVVERLTLCPGPHDAQVDPAGRRVAITCSLGDEVVIIDAETLDEVARFPVDTERGEPGAPHFKPLNVVWSRNGDTLFVSLHLAGMVRLFDAGGMPLGSVEVGAGPAQLAITPDGRALVTANRKDRSVSIVDVASLTEAHRITIEGAHPHGAATDPTGRRAYVTFEGDVRHPGGVVAIDLLDGSVLWQVEAGAYTLGVAYTEIPGT